MSSFAKGKLKKPERYVKKEEKKGVVEGVRKWCTARTIVWNWCASAQPRSNPSNPTIRSFSWAAPMDRSEYSPRKRNLPPPTGPSPTRWRRTSPGSRRSPCSQWRWWSHESSSSRSPNPSPSTDSLPSRPSRSSPRPRAPTSSAGTTAVDSSASPGRSAFASSDTTVTLIHSFFPRVSPLLLLWSIQIEIECVFVLPLIYPKSC